MNQKASVLVICSLTLTLLLLHLNCVKGPSETEGTVHGGPTRAVALNVSNFDSLALRANITSVVEFYSAGCQTCQGMAWVIDSMAVRSTDTVFFGAVNIDKGSCDTLLTRYDIKTVPTYIFFHKGAQAARRSFSVVSPASYDTLTFILDEILKGHISNDTADTADTTTHFPDTLPTILTPANFTAFITATDRVAMVEFFSPSCYHCQTMELPVANLNIRFKGRAFIGKVNVEEQDSLVSAYNVEGWPLFIFFVGGVEQCRELGSMPEDSLAAKLDSIIGIVH